MIAGWVIVSLAIAGIYGFYTEYQEVKCDKAYEKVDSCRERYNTDVCKDVYLPKSCEDKE